MDKKELFLQELKKVWKDSERMVNYCFKKADCIVELDNGDILTIDKPSIETRFCFGYGYCGVSTQEEIDRAYDAETRARENGEYFKRENLRTLNAWIDELKDDSKKIYKFISYYGLEEDDHLKSVRVFDYWESVPNGAIEITENERKAILAGYEEVKARFEKRLNSYLKRYGTSKLKTWTYLVD